MGKRNRKKAISVILVFCFVSGVLLFIIESGGVKKYSEVIKKNWDIDLPMERKALYEFSQDSTLGDGVRYHVLKYKESDKIDKYLQFKSSENMNIAKHINNILDKIYVPKDEKPNFDKDYRYYCKQKDDASIIYLLYMPEEEEVYVVEDIY